MSIAQPKINQIPKELSVKAKATEKEQGLFQQKAIENTIPKENFANLPLVEDVKEIAQEVSQETSTKDKEIFVCTYGSTTYAEISKAISEGKVPVCYYNSALYVYSYASSNSYNFTASYSVTARYLFCRNDDVWYAGTTTLETTSNKETTTLDATSTTKYPCSKVVADRYTIQTTAPTSAISDEGIHLVFLDSEPATEYNGYIYYIQES